MLSVHAFLVQGLLPYTVSFNMPICENGTGSDLTNWVVTILNLLFCHQEHFVNSMHALL